VANSGNRRSSYLEGLLHGTGRKTGRHLAELAGEARPHRVQAVLGRGRWDAQAGRDLVRGYVAQALGDPGAVLVADEVAFPKAGEHSVGVARQRAASTGRVENCQLGVFLAYASRYGQALVDRRLLLPEAWACDAERRARSGIPAGVSFATRPAVAGNMLEKALDAGLPCAFVLVEAPYGTDPRLRAALEDRRTAHLVAAPQDEPSEALAGRSPAALAEALAPEAWTSLPIRDEAIGARLHDWNRVALANETRLPGWRNWLLIRRNRRDRDDWSSYLAFAQEGTPLAELAGVAGLHRTCATCVAVARAEFGLDHYEARSWDGWHRHETLCMAALAFSARLRATLVRMAGA
jgi:SRSO17 transposase